MRALTVASALTAAGAVLVLLGIAGICLRVVRFCRRKAKAAGGSGAPSRPS